MAGGLIGNNSTTHLGTNSKNSRNFKPKNKSTGIIESQHYKYKSGDKCRHRVRRRIFVTSVRNGEDYDGD